MHVGLVRAFVYSYWWSILNVWFLTLLWIEKILVVGVKFIWRGEVCMLSFVVSVLGLLYIIFGTEMNCCMVILLVQRSSWFSKLNGRLYLDWLLDARLRRLLIACCWLGNGIYSNYFLCNSVCCFICWFVAIVNS
jgi:hypothetical protein